MSRAEDPAISIAAYCVGQAQSRVAGLTASARQETRQIDTGDTSKDEAVLSYRYMHKKGLLLNAEMQWMTGALTMMAKSAPGTDPKQLQAALARGRDGGTLLFAAEGQCKSDCTGYADDDDFAKCIEDCADRTEHAAFDLARKCDELYLKSRK